MLLVATVDQYFIFDGARELDRKRYLVLNKSATSRVMYAYLNITGKVMYYMLHVVGKGELHDVILCYMLV